MPARKHIISRMPRKVSGVPKEDIESAEKDIGINEKSIGRQSYYVYQVGSVNV